MVQNMTWPIFNSEQEKKIRKVKVFYSDLYASDKHELIVHCDNQIIAKKYREILEEHLL